MVKIDSQLNHIKSCLSNVRDMVSLTPISEGSSPSMLSVKICEETEKRYFLTTENVDL
jgi:hypothetical protein